MDDYGQELYYASPTQLVYYNFQTNSYVGGIGYRDFIIGAAGQIVVIEDLFRFAKRHSQPTDDTIIELSWTSLNDLIFSKLM